MRIRFFLAAITFSGTISATVPGASGRNSDVSTASIRHSGRKIRAACGAASNSATISGRCRTNLSCSPEPATCHPPSQTSQPNFAGQIRGMTGATTTGVRAATTTRDLQRQSFPAWNCAASRSNFPQISYSRRDISRFSASLINFRTPQAPNTMRSDAMTVETV